MRSAASNSVTSWPRSAAVVAQARPAGPAPTTAIFLRVAALAITSSTMAGARIDQARGQLAVEDVVEAGLIAGDAGIDLVAAMGGR